MTAVREQTSTQVSNGQNGRHENGAQGSLKEARELPVTAQLFFTDAGKWIDAIDKTQKEPEKYITFYPTPVSTKSRRYSFQEIRNAVEAQNNYTVTLGKNHSLHIHFRFAASVPPVYAGEMMRLDVQGFSVVMELRKTEVTEEQETESDDTVLLQMIRDAATEFKSPKGFHQIPAPSEDRVSFQSNFGNTYEAGISEGRLVIALNNFVRASSVLTDILPLMKAIVVRGLEKFRTSDTVTATNEVVFSPPKVGERNAPLSAEYLAKSMKTQFSGE